MARHNQIGKWGEQVACEYLMGKGYAIVHRNWRSGNIEIDIVAMHDNRVVFVEVKTRSDKNSCPEDAVDRRRCARMVRAADTYIARYDIPHEVQYDIIAISGDIHDYNITHFEDAFYAPLGLRR